MKVYHRRRGGVSFSRLLGTRRTRALTFEIRASKRSILEQHRLADAHADCEENRDQPWCIGTAKPPVNAKRNEDRRGAQRRDHPRCDGSEDFLVSTRVDPSIRGRSAELTRDGADEQAENAHGSGGVPNGWRLSCGA